MSDQKESVFPYRIPDFNKPANIPDKSWERWKKSLREMTAGYGVKIPDLFVVFDQVYDEVILLKNVEFVSVCEHHLLPFSGIGHVAYVPRQQSGKVIGVSKLGRLLDAISMRFQIQERICSEVVSAIEEHLNPIGSACVLKAKHQCVSCRGVKKPTAEMVTCKLAGCFREKPEARAELFQLISL